MNTTMREFDHSLWESRAYGRRDRALEKGYSACAIETELKRNLLAAKDIKQIVEWASKKKIKVFFVKQESGEWQHDTKMAIIATSLNPVNQSVILLHELGHYLVDSRSCTDERFIQGYPRQMIPSVHHEFNHRLACLEEEMEAWNRGWKLATRLKLNVKRSEFDEMRIKCLKSYIKWSVNPKPCSLNNE